MAASFEHRAQLRFKGHAFLLTVSGSLSDTLSAAQGPAAPSGSTGLLRVTLEDINIEEVTKKTGNYKKFPIFVEMLLSALKK
eukprot:jgi/Hompol1/4484/HPOL_003651-RA